MLAAVSDEILASDVGRGLADDIPLRELALRLVRNPADRRERDCGVCAQDATGRI